MVIYCCVPNCKTQSGKGIILHRFPRDDKLLAKWFSAIRNRLLYSKDESCILQTCRVCHNHFADEQKIECGRRGANLKCDAVPTVNLGMELQNNYNNVCYPGQTITGRVNLALREQKSIRAISIRFTGDCNTYWTDSETYYDEFFKENRTRFVNYTGEEVYFDEEYNLYRGEGASSLPLGTHSYLFSYILPQQLPNSYEDIWSKICYTIKATVDSPWQFDSTAVVVLNLVSLLDLNYLPRIREPAQISIDKTMCSCWCNNADPLTFTLTLPVVGYVPGQDIQIGCYVENLTNVNVEKINLNITKLTELIAQYPSPHRKFQQEIVATTSEGGIGAHGDKSWTTILKIPYDLAVPNIIPCNLINIIYNLNAEAVVPCPHTNLTASIPIVIGNVPLTEIIATNTANVPYFNASAPPSDFSNETTPIIEAAGAAPPSYEEAQKLKENYGT